MWLQAACLRNTPQLTHSAIYSTFDKYCTWFVGAGSASTACLWTKHSASHSMSFKVIENNTIRQIVYEFLFVFHCNYDRILCHFQTKARYWSKNANFSYPLPFNLHGHLEPLLIFSQNFNTNCPWVPGLLDGAKIFNRCIGCNNITDRQTTDGRLMSQGERNVTSA